MLPAQRRRWCCASTILVLLSACGGGSSRDTADPSDTTPDPFVFIEQVDVPLGSHVESNPITVTGTTGSAPIAGDEIVEGRCCPRPLPEALGHSINIVVWGGREDVGPATGSPLADYGPAARLAANYNASQRDVVTIFCAGDHGQMWPQSTGFTAWLAETLRSHPKGTPRHAFSLPPPPAGFDCAV